jgi:hypothetical protein
LLPGKAGKRLLDNAITKTPTIYTHRVLTVKKKEKDSTPCVGSGEEMLTANEKRGGIPIDGSLRPRFFEL